MATLDTPTQKNSADGIEVDVSHDLRLKDQHDKTSKTPILQSPLTPSQIPNLDLQINNNPTKSPQASLQHSSSLYYLLGSTVGAKKQTHLPSLPQSRTNTSAELRPQANERSKVTWLIEVV
jgi:hypothetical protein